MIVEKAFKFKRRISMYSLQQVKCDWRKINHKTIFIRVQGEIWHCSIWVCWAAINKICCEHPQRFFWSFGCWTCFENYLYHSNFITAVISKAEKMLCRWKWTIFDIFTYEVNYHFSGQDSVQNSIVGVVRHFKRCPQLYSNLRHHVIRLKQWCTILNSKSM